MKVAPRQFQIILFGSFEDLEPNLDNLKYFMEVFADKELVPTTFQELEIRPGINTVGLPGLPTRFALNSSDGVWSIQFGIQQLTITRKNKVFGEDDLGSLGAFAESSIEIVRRIDERFRKTFHRMALITTTVLHEMDKSENSHAYRVIFRPSAFYNEFEPFEWNSRSVAHYPIELKEKDKLNVITEANRAVLNIGNPEGVISKDGCLLKFDLNTDHTNASYRFDIESVCSFIQLSTQLRDKLHSEFLEGLEKNNEKE